MNDEPAVPSTGASADENIRSWIDHYQDYFAAEVEDLERILDAGETDFARIIAGLQRARTARQPSYIRMTESGGDNDGVVRYVIAPPGHVFSDTLPTDIRCYWQTVGPHGHLEVPAYIRAEDFLPRFLADHVARQGIDAVVDLGGGWGRVLFEAWREGIPAGTSLYCLDTSKSAETMFGRLRALAPGINISFVRGNARGNDLSFVGTVHRLLIVTSGYVIMDPDIDRSDIERWARAAPVVQCVNLEPVGFQLQREGTAPAAHDRWLSKRASERHMNATYMGRLLDLQKEGVLRVSNFQKHYLFDTDPVMPKSFIFWRTD